MKTLALTAATLGLFLMASAPKAMADDSMSPAMDHHGSKHGNWDEGKMKAALGLSDDQVAKLKALRSAEKDAVKPLMEKERGLMAKLNDQSVNKAPDADIQTTLNDLKANRQALRDQMEKMQAEKAAILTPTQQAKMLLQRRQMMKRAFGKRGGPKERGPGKPMDDQEQDEHP